MALEVEGPTAPLIHETVNVLAQLETVREEFTILSNEQLEKTYWSLLGAMVFSATTNAEAPAIEDGRKAPWYAELMAGRLISGLLVTKIDQRNPYQQPPRSAVLHQEAKASYTPQELSASMFSFTGTATEAIF